MKNNPLKWYHAAIIGGGVVGLSWLIYYLTREEENEETNADTSQKDETISTKDKTTLIEKKVDAKTATLPEVQNILNRVIESQEKMRTVMKDLYSELAKNTFTFDEVYHKVKAVEPEDPLEVTGITMTEFDELLDKYSSDPCVRECIGKIVTNPVPLNFSEKAASITAEKVIAIHRFMLERIRKLSKHFRSLPHSDSYDIKTATIAIQAMVGAQVEEEFGFSTEEVETAVLLCHHELSSNPEFNAINTEMQSTMGELFGPPSFVRQSS